ncbi:hypothetical protein Agabi119p4_10472 [Agaricus bisporus var. burnettii]|uniref:Uncharacterized protein n=1 Tax=Agaricus bisporus var. burnettii TaxID=192524 RepID=A0A8H7EWA4_AGABI|nr:hypothetical protein Agabi119p4_10472 [Agaricus bisporus var. burnettii]
MATVHYRWGGFVISLETAADWAFRISGKTLRPRQYDAIQTVIKAKVNPFKAGFRLVGDTREEMAFMVITQSERLQDYKKNNPVPQFEEGEMEAMAKPLLEREGQSIIINITAFSD